MKKNLMTKIIQIKCADITGIYLEGIASVGLVHISTP